MDRASRESPTAAFWKPTSILADTRLAPGETDIKHYSFALSDQGPVSVEARLIFRRTFQALAGVKGWKAEDIIMAARHLARHYEAAAKPVPDTLGALT